MEIPNSVVLQSHQLAFDAFMLGRIYGEDLFHAGASGEKMYFIQSGRLNYASILNCKMLHFCFLCTVCDSGFIQQTDSSERSLEITGGSQHPHPGGNPT